MKIAVMDTLQLIQLLHYRVIYICFILISTNISFCCILTAYLFFADIASRLGYDTLDAVTTEDMVWEVKENSLQV